MMDDEDSLDIYCDLITDEHNDNIQSNDEMGKLLSSAKSDLEDLQKQLDERKQSDMLIVQENEDLKKNISALLLTAKSELQRKDLIIGDLREQVEEHTKQSFYNGKFNRISAHRHPSPIIRYNETKQEQVKNPKKRKKSEKLEQEELKRGKFEVENRERFHLNVKDNISSECSVTNYRHATDSVNNLNNKCTVIDTNKTARDECSKVSCKTISVLQRREESVGTDKRKVIDLREKLKQRRSSQKQENVLIDGKKSCRTLTIPNVALVETDSVSNASASSLIDNTNTSEYFPNKYRLYKLDSSITNKTNSRKVNDTKISSTTVDSKMDENRLLMNRIKEQSDSLTNSISNNSITSQHTSKTQDFHDSPLHVSKLKSETFSDNNCVSAHINNVSLDTVPKGKNSACRDGDLLEERTSREYTYNTDTSEDSDTSGKRLVIDTSARKYYSPKLNVFNVPNTRNNKPDTDVSTNSTRVKNICESNVAATKNKNEIEPVLNNKIETDLSKDIPHDNIISDNNCLEQNDSDNLSYYTNGQVLKSSTDSAQSGETDSSSNNDISDKLRIKNQITTKKTEKHICKSSSKTADQNLVSHSSSKSKTHLKINLKPNVSDSNRETCAFNTDTESISKSGLRSRSGSEQDETSGISKQSEEVKNTKFHSESTKTFKTSSRLKQSSSENGKQPNKMFSPDDKKLKTKNTQVSSDVQITDPKANQQEAKLLSIDIKQSEVKSLTLGTISLPTDLHNRDKFTKPKSVKEPVSLPTTTANRDVQKSVSNSNFISQSVPKGKDSAVAKLICDDTKNDKETDDIKTCVKRTQKLCTAVDPQNTSRITEKIKIKKSKTDDLAENPLISTHISKKDEQKLEKSSKHLISNEKTKSLFVGKQSEKVSTSIKQTQREVQKYKEKEKNQKSSNRTSSNKKRKPEAMSTKDYSENKEERYAKKSFDQAEDSCMELNPAIFPGIEEGSNNKVDLDVGDEFRQKQNEIILVKDIESKASNLEIKSSGLSEQFTKLSQNIPVPMLLDEKLTDSNLPFTDVSLPVSKTNNASFVVKPTQDIQDVQITESTAKTEQVNNPTYEDTTPFVVLTNDKNQTEINAVDTSVPQIHNRSSETLSLDNVTLNASVSATTTDSSSGGWLSKLLSAGCENEFLKRLQKMEEDIQILKSVALQSNSLSSPNMNISRGESSNSHQHSTQCIEMNTQDTSVMNNTSLCTSLSSLPDANIDGSVKSLKEPCGVSPEELDLADKSLGESSDSIKHPSNMEISLHSMEDSNCSMSSQSSSISVNSADSSNSLARSKNVQNSFTINETLIECEPNHSDSDEGSDSTDDEENMESTELELSACDRSMVEILKSDLDISSDSEGTSQNASLDVTQNIPKTPSKAERLTNVQSFHWNRISPVPKFVSPQSVNCDSKLLALINLSAHNSQLFGHTVSFNSHGNSSAIAVGSDADNETKRLEFSMTPSKLPVKSSTPQGKKEVNDRSVENAVDLSDGEVIDSDSDHDGCGPSVMEALETSMLNSNTCVKNDNSVQVISTKKQRVSPIKLFRLKKCPKTAAVAAEVKKSGKEHQSIKDNKLNIEDFQIFQGNPEQEDTNCSKVNSLTESVEDGEITQDSIIESNSTDQLLDTDSVNFVFDAKVDDDDELLKYSDDDVPAHENFKPKLKAISPKKQMLPPTRTRYSPRIKGRSIEDRLGNSSRSECSKRHDSRDNSRRTVDDRRKRRSNSPNPCNNERRRFYGSRHHDEHNVQSSRRGESGTSSRSSSSRSSKDVERERMTSSERNRKRDSDRDRSKDRSSSRNTRSRS